MKNVFEKLDKKYLKICAYAAVTAIITVILGVLLLSTGPFWQKLWNITTAVLKPIVIGGIIWYLLFPIVNRFEKMFNKNKKHKWARPLGVLLTFFIIVAVILFILVLIAITVYKNVENLSFETIQNLYVALQNDYKEVWQFVEEKMQFTESSSGNMATLVSGVTGAVTNFFSGLLFGVIFSIYFLLDESRISTYWVRAFHLIFGEKAGEKLMLFAKDADNAFSGYIRGQFLDALLVGVISIIALSIATVPNAILVGVLVGLGNMIPYVGPVVGYIAVVIVCLPEGAFVKMIIGIGVLALVMFIDGNIINPKLLSDNVDVHPLLVVAALIGGGAIGGILGMLVAVPTAALLKLQFDRYLERVSEKKKQDE